MQHRQITLGAKKYVVQQLLGEGGFARVFKAQEQQPGGNILAVKVRAKNLEDILSSIIVLLNVVFPQAGLSYYFCRKYLIIIIIFFNFHWFQYEVPSCAWEMYILSEVRARISAQYSNILSSIMKVALFLPTFLFQQCIFQVTEAHIFTNASLLFNEYLPLGNLLDLTNKLNDPRSVWSTKYRI